MKIRYFLSTASVFLLFAVFGATANAQWIDPVEFSNTPDVVYNYVAPAPSPSIVSEVSSPAETFVAQPETVVIPVWASPSVQEVNPSPTVTHPPPPTNPYENLPPGAIPPSRPAIPNNPYENLPAGVTVPRPGICNPFRGCFMGQHVDLVVS